jgi:hypothetical protein
LFCQAYRRTLMVNVVWTSGEAPWSPNWLSAHTTQFAPPTRMSETIAKTSHTRLEPPARRA